MLKRILSLGIHPALSFEQQNKIRVFNTACTLVFVISLFYLLFALAFDFYLAVLVSLFSLMSITTALFLVHFRRYWFAFHFTMVYGFVFQTAFTLLFGATSKSYYYFFFMPVASTILFDSIKITVKYMVLSIVYLLLNVAFTENMHSYYNIEDMWYFGYPNMVFTILLSFLGLRLFKQENLKYSRQIEEQKYKLEEKNKEMTDSINYARRIQYTLLSPPDFLRSNLPEHFVLFKPKDIVSGDFYWAAKKRDLFYLAVCDSTGHGVPGAFMSLLNSSFLNEALNEKNITDTDQVLNHVRCRLIESISQEGGKDGMDAILLCYDRENASLSYSAANNAPLLVRDDKIVALSKDKMPVGQGDKKDSFTAHTHKVRTGDCLYLLTDGYADQFGGLHGKKFKSRQLEELLFSCYQKPIAEQKLLLEARFDEWKGNLEQVDDVCIIGIRF